MNMKTPDFDELVGRDLGGPERARLEHVHELLVAAGAPEELPPSLAAGPTFGMTLGRRRTGRGRRRVLLLAATLTVLVLTFLFGYIAGNHGGGGVAGAKTLRLAGTNAAPAALASLRILPADRSGNWPMELTATGLPKLGAKDYYEVFLVRNGKIYAPCGSFLSTRTDGAVDVTLNAPYRLGEHDSWIVTRQRWGDHEAGRVVLKPTASA
jgi:hypothetical protein